MSTAKLKGLVSIVTGASRGIGASAARLLADEGSAVVLTARDEEWLELTAREIRDRGGRAIAVAADITDPAQVEEIVESALGKYDKVDIVVNAAGSAWPIGAAADTDAEEWAYAVHTNLIGPFTLVNNVLPLMIDQGYGRIVNLTCRSGRDLGVSESALRAAKAGLEAWSGVVAKELAGTGVSIQCLDPGVVDTATRREVLEMDAGDDLVDISGWLPDATVGELCSTDEAARMVLRLIVGGDIDGLGHVVRAANLVRLA